MIKKAPRNLRYIQFAVIVLAAFFLNSCNGLLGSSNNSSSNSKSPVIIKGRVVTYQPSSGTYVPVSGANVVLDQLQYTGALSTISGVSGQTGSDGSFAINAKLASNVFTVVIATKGNNKYMDVAIPSSKSGQIISYQSFLSEKSTIETRIFIEAVAQSQGQYANLNSIRSIMSDSLAQMVSSDTSSINTLATAFANRDYARINTLAGSLVGANSLQLNDIAAYQNLSVARLDSALNLNYAKKDSINSDYLDFYSNSTHAYNVAGLSNVAYVLVNNTANQVLLNSLTSLSPNLQFRMNRQRAIYMSHAVTSDVYHQFSSASAPFAIMDSVTNANNQLQTAFMDAKSDTMIKEAYSTYHKKIFSALKKTYQSYSDSLASVETDINGPNGMKAQLASSVSSSSTSSSSAVQAFSSYYYNIGTDIQSKISSATTTQLFIINSIIDDINLYI